MLHPALVKTLLGKKYMEVLILERLLNHRLEYEDLSYDKIAMHMSMELDT